MKKIPLKITLPIFFASLITIFAFYMPLASKQALEEEGARGTVCIGYDYQNPDTKEYHILQGKLSTYMSLGEMPSRPVNCSRPVQAKLYL